MLFLYKFPTCVRNITILLNLRVSNSYKITFIKSSGDIATSIIIQVTGRYIIIHVTFFYAFKFKSNNIFSRGSNKQMLTYIYII